jgi:hypothetical protein
VAVVGEGEEASTLLLQTAPESRVLLREGESVGGREVAQIRGLIPGAQEGLLVSTLSGIYGLNASGSVVPVLIEGGVLDDGTEFRRAQRILPGDPSGWVVVAETDAGSALLRVYGSRVIPVVRPKQIVPGAGAVDEVAVSAGGPALEVGPDHTIVFSVRTVDNRLFVLVATTDSVSVLGAGQVLEADVGRAGEGPQAGFADDATGGWSHSPLDVDTRINQTTTLPTTAPLVNVFQGPSGEVQETTGVFQDVTPETIGPTIDALRRLQQVFRGPQ